MDSPVIFYRYHQLALFSFFFFSETTNKPFESKFTGIFLLGLGCYSSLQSLAFVLLGNPR